MLLWDFGDTLADERWMLRAPSRFPGWPEAWADVMADEADRWNAGSASGAEIFDALAHRTGMTLREVEAHARNERIEFHPNAWRVASEHRLPQALVTVNPDLFEQYVHGLSAVFDAVVMSFAEGTNDRRCSATSHCGVSITMATGPPHCSSTTAPTSSKHGDRRGAPAIGSRAMMSSAGTSKARSAGSVNRRSRPPAAGDSL